jgi:hypothetical protein
MCDLVIEAYRPAGLRVQSRPEEAIGMRNGNGGTIQQSFLRCSRYHSTRPRSVAQRDRTSPQDFCLLPCI